MPVMSVTNFGGIAPAILPRALPDNGAQTAHNLFARTVEFRPLAQDTVAASSAVSNPKTIYRTSRSSGGGLNTDPATGWKVSGDIMHYVKGQVNDDLTERTYYTFGGGTQPPRVFDIKGQDRKLGVPPPGEAPAVEVVVVDEITADEVRDNGSVPESTAKYFTDALTAEYVGQEADSMPPGYFRYSDFPGIFKNDLDTYGLRVFQRSSQNGPLMDPNYQWVLGAGGKTYQWEGNWWYAISFLAYGRKYIFDSAKLRTSLEGATVSGSDTPLTAEYIDSMVELADRTYQEAVSGSAQKSDDLHDALSGIYDSIELASGSDASKVSALRSAIAQLKTAVNAYTAWWSGWADEANAVDVVGTEISENGFGLPEVVERIVDYRFYVYTYVTDWGEESAPSPVSELAEVDQNDSTTITLSAPPSGRFITKWRLYRSNSGTQRAEFQFLAEGDASELTFADEVKPASLAEVCPTTAWLEPPEKLTGMVGLPNGIMAGFVDNYVAFCEPYHPYAWPVEYQITTEWPIVALGVYGQTVVVGTTGNPYYMSGADSASMSAVKLDANQACVSARSMVSVDGGVVYASPDGLCLANEQGVKLITQNHFTRTEWQALRPESMVSAYHEMTYFFMPPVGTSCYALHLETGKLTTLEMSGSAFYSDMLTDRLYMAKGGQIMACFASDTLRTGKWRSKVAVAPAHCSYAWVAVESNFEQGPVTVRWYGDGALRYTASVSSREPVRLPAGRWLEHEIEVETGSRVNKVTVASSGAELRAA